MLYAVKDFQCGGDGDGDGDGTERTEYEYRLQSWRWILYIQSLQYTSWSWLLLFEVLEWEYLALNQQRPKAPSLKHPGSYAQPTSNHCASETITIFMKDHHHLHEGPSPSSWRTITIFMKGHHHLHEEPSSSSRKTITIMKGHQHLHEGPSPSSWRTIAISLLDALLTRSASSSREVFAKFVWLSRRSSEDSATLCSRLEILVNSRDSCCWASATLASSWRVCFCIHHCERWRWTTKSDALRLIQSRNYLQNSDIELPYIFFGFHPLNFSLQFGYPRLVNTDIFGILIHRQS